VCRYVTTVTVFVSVLLIKIVFSYLEESLNGRIILKRILNYLGGLDLFDIDYDRDKRRGVN
jgi:hypothetical protein